MTYIEWVDAMTLSDARVASMTHRNQILAALRKGRSSTGGYHEHIPVAEFIKAKAVGLSAQAQADFSTLTGETRGDILDSNGNPTGRWVHSGKWGSAMHRALVLDAGFVNAKTADELYAAIELFHNTRFRLDSGLPAKPNAWTTIEPLCN